MVSSLLRLGVGMLGVSTNQHVVGEGRFRVCWRELKCSIPRIYIAALYLSYFTHLKRTLLASKKSLNISLPHVVNSEFLGHVWQPRIL